VKYRLWAAIVAFSVMTTSGALIADSPVTSWVIVVDVEDDIVAGLDHLWSPTELKHLLDTVHLEGPDWTQYPPGPTRTFVKRWNKWVKTAETWLEEAEEECENDCECDDGGSLSTEQLQTLQTKFMKLLKYAADNNIRVDFVRRQTANTDGTFDLISVQPPPP
jgi:hypothetical protein